MDKLEALTALYESTRALGVGIDLGALLDDILARAQVLIGFEHCGLMLFDAERGELSVERLHGFEETAARSLALRLRLGEGIAGSAAQQRQALRVGDVLRDPRYVSGLACARSNMAVPMLLANQLVGVINVESTRPDAFTEEHEKLLTVLGTQAALAIQAARSRDRLEQHIRELNALYRISRLATEIHDVDGILAAVLAIAADVVPADHASVLLLDPDQRALRVRAARGPEDEGGADSIPFGVGVTGRCAQTREPVIEDVAASAEYIPGLRGARSEVAVPLVSDGQVLGVLNLESRQRQAYQASHVRTLSVMAQQAAAVLRTAQLHAEARHLAVTDPLTGLFNRRHFIGQLDEHLRRSHRYPESLAVVLLDVDNLKPLNDSHGHAAGDQALLAVARAMQEWVRGTDQVARLGGDEFAALLLRSDAEQALQVVDRLRLVVEHLALEIPGGIAAVHLTFSAGIALFPIDGVATQALLSRADTALYAAKRTGKNKVVVAQQQALGAETH